LCLRQKFLSKRLTPETPTPPDALPFTIARLRPPVFQMILQFLTPRKAVLREVVTSFEFYEGFTASFPGKPSQEPKTARIVSIGLRAGEDLAAL
jgi:hypothetical protein